MSNINSKLIFALIIFILAFATLNTFMYIYKHQNELIEDKESTSPDLYVESLGSTYNGISLKEVANTEADKSDTTVSYIQQISENEFEVGLENNEVFSIIIENDNMSVRYPDKEKESNDEE